MACRQNVGVGLRTRFAQRSVRNAMSLTSRRRAVGASSASAEDGSSLNAVSESARLVSGLTLRLIVRPTPISTSGTERHEK